MIYFSPILEDKDSEIPHMYPLKSLGECNVLRIIRSYLDIPADEDSEIPHTHVSSKIYRSM